MGAQDRGSGALRLGQSRRLARRLVLALAAALVVACGRGSPLAARPRPGAERGGGAGPALDLSGADGRATAGSRRG